MRNGPGRELNTADLWWINRNGCCEDIRSMKESPKDVNKVYVQPVVLISPVKPTNLKFEALCWYFTSTSKHEFLFTSVIKEFQVRYVFS